MGDNIQKNVQTKIGNDNNWVIVAAGGTFSLELKSNGTLWGWGDGFIGHLGNGSNVPKQIGNANQWVSTTSGYFHSFGIMADGSL